MSSPRMYFQAYHTHQRLRPTQLFSNLLGQIRVFDGTAIVEVAGQQIEVKSGRQLSLNARGKLKARKFDKKTYTDDFYRWASLRSSYLAEANVDAARTYGGGSGWSPTPFYGNGWYWDSWFDAYTFIPDDGISFDPFGWGFYSPWDAYGAPYYGYGYGYGGYGYRGVGYPRHFGPGYQPRYAAGGRTSGSVGHACNVRGGSLGGFRSGGGFGGGGFAVAEVSVEAASVPIAVCLTRWGSPQRGTKPCQNDCLLLSMS